MRQDEALAASHGAAYGVASDRLQALVGEKLLLDLSECQSLTGLSRAHLRAAMASGELQAKRIGRSFKVRREELERWVRETC